MLSWVSGARLGRGGEVYIGAEGMCEDRHSTVIDEEKEKTLKIGHMTLYAKLL
jgi:hypothetical protein